MDAGGEEGSSKGGEVVLRLRFCVEGFSGLSVERNSRFSLFLEEKVFEGYMGFNGSSLWSSWLSKGIKSAFESKFRDMGSVKRKPVSSDRAMESPRPTMLSSRSQMSSSLGVETPNGSGLRSCWGLDFSPKRTEGDGKSSIQLSS